MTTCIVVVSDLHFGSTSGICPPEGIQIPDGVTAQPSKVQQALWKLWVDFWDKFALPRAEKAKRKILVINGDLIDGDHHKTVNIVTNSIEHQRLAAIQTLRPLVRRFDQVYVIRGTEAHVGPGAQADDEIGRALGAEVDDNGEGSHWQLWAEWEGVLFQFAHHIGVTSSTAYESSAPMREMVAAFVESGQWGQQTPDVVVRSHRHRYVRVMIPCRRGEAMSLITPGWQMRTPFVERIDRMRMPHIGGVVFMAEEGKCKVYPKVYPLLGLTVRH